VINVAYEKQNFTDGTVLHDYHLNNMENQIYDNTEQISTRLEIVDASGANHDMDKIFGSGRHCKIYLTDKDTLNTPHAKGATTFMRSYILSMANSVMYGKQIAYSMGGSTFERKLKDGVIGDWTKIYNANEVKDLIQTAIDATWEASY
jgi:hypothetical protein